MAASTLLRLQKPALISRFITLLSARFPQRFKHVLTDSDTEAELERELGPKVLPFKAQVDRRKWRKLDARVLGLNRSMISGSSWAVLKILKAEGFEAYLVGGCVRDLILHRTPKDFDVITTAQLKQVKESFHRCMIVGQRFPVCRVLIKGSVVEVSSFETVTQADEEDRVITSEIPSGCDEKDFAIWRNSVRRDFTVNSLFLDPFEFKVYDYASGMVDLRFLKLRTLVPAELSFEEDCARILRGLRIAARLRLSISEETEHAILKFSSSIKSLGKGRILMELNYMLSYGAAEASLNLLRRFKLLDILLPHHAAYLDQQASNLVAQRSVMLLELFSHLDNLVTCDQPCNTALWAGLLSFHLALLNNPQSAYTVIAFASTLYHGKWTEGIKSARKEHQLKADFVPEIAGSYEFQSDEELASKVAKLAASVQESLNALIGKESFAVSTDALTETECSVGSEDSLLQCTGLVCLPRKIASDVSGIFEVLVNDIRSYEDERESYKINYPLLRKGNVSETRFVLGKVILETVCGEVVHNGRKGAAEIEMANMCEEEKKSEYIGEVSDLYLSDVRKDTEVVQRNRKGKLLPVDARLQKLGDENLELVDKCHHSVQKQQQIEKHNCLDLIKKHLKVTKGKLYTSFNKMKEVLYVECQHSEKKQKTTEKESCLDMVKKHKHHIAQDEELGKQVKRDIESKPHVYEVVEEIWQSRITEDERLILRLPDLIKQKMVSKEEQKQGQTALHAELEDNEASKSKDENSILALTNLMRVKLIAKKKEKQDQSVECKEDWAKKFVNEKSIMALWDMIAKKTVNSGEFLSPCEAELERKGAEGPKLAGKGCHHIEQKQEIIQINDCFDMTMKYLDKNHYVSPESNLLQKKENISLVKHERARKKSEKHSQDVGVKKGRKLSSLF